MSVTLQILRRDLFVLASSKSVLFILYDKLYDIDKQFDYLTIVSVFVL